METLVHTPALVAFDCDQCECSFSNAMLLLAHAAEHDTNQIRRNPTWPVWCTTCFRAFWKPAAYASHTCTVVAPRVSTLHEDMQTRARRIIDTANAKCMCLVCFKIVGDARDLESHLRDHVSSLS